MSGKLIPILCLAAVVAFTTLACQDQDSPVSPVEPQIAQKGKPTPTPTPVEPKLEEFWVVPGATNTAADVLHIVWSGGGTAVNPSVVWDYFFDGIRDDDPPVDDHYEYEMPGPPLTLGIKDPSLPIGWHHADIAFDGTRRDGVYPYPDFLATEVPNEGDPFAFRLTFLDEAGTRAGGATPFGVVVGGNNEFGVIDPTNTVHSVVEGHDQGIAVRSYATFKGDEAKGFLSITELSMTSVSCKAMSVRVDGVRTKQTHVSGDVTLAFAEDQTISLPDRDYIWFEGHFLDEATGAFTGRGSGHGSGTFSASGTMPPGWTRGSVSFVIDYVVSSASTTTTNADLLKAAYYVYNPGANTVRTTAGFSQIPWGDGTGPNPNSAVKQGKFPVAHTETFSVNCG